MKNIGFLSYWGIGRGLAYVTLCFVKMLKDDYNCFVLKQGTNEDGNEFRIPEVTVTQYPNYFVPVDLFKEWITTNKLDVVVFNEYNLWTPKDTNNLPKVAKELGCKVYANIVFERLNELNPEDFDRIIVTSKTGQKLMRINKIRNHTYIPYSLDLTEFSTERLPRENDDFVFFHPAGFGGVNERKNTRVVIEAFKRLNNPKTKLIITSQSPLKIENCPENITLISADLSREDLLKYYRMCDAVVLPSKWETIGIPILESLASGVPVVTMNVPPMSEFVRVGTNGYLCKPSITNYPGISIKVAEVDATELKANMENIMNLDILPLLKRNSRVVIEREYDIVKNKKYFTDFLKKELGE